MPLAIRTLLFTLFVPGSVVILLPAFINSNFSYRYEIGDWKYLGLIPFSAGFIIYCWTALSFLLKGSGTPAIWFTRPLKFILGEEPLKLVSQGLYRFSRNPMYLGVLIMILGESIYFQNPALFIYFITFFIIFHLVVVFIEEPHLKKKFGENYLNYLNAVRRWI